jgi:hypothetical protein
MNIFRTTLFMITGIVVASCSTHNPRTGQEENGFPVHGNFCGPYIPTIAFDTAQTMAEQLTSIAPIDRIDAACKAHDLCYIRRGIHARRGDFDRSCDKDFMRTLSGLERRYENTDCWFIVKGMQAYFGTENPSLAKDPGTQAVDVAGTIVTSGILLYYKSIGMAVGMPIAVLSGKNPVEAAKIANEATNEVLLVYPGRYHKCH